MHRNVSVRPQSLSRSVSQVEVPVITTAPQPVNQCPERVLFYRPSQPLMGHRRGHIARWSVHGRTEGRTPDRS